jgi:hypothetical protein
VEKINMNNPEESKAQFLPFHAINEFMRDDYRLTVVRAALAAQPDLPEEMQQSIERQTKKSVQVPGFRNSAKAPAAVRAKPTADAFAKNPRLVAAILAAWTEAHPELRQQVFDLLTERDWPLVPIDADRTKLPGFVTKWPKDESFEILNKTFHEKYPDSTANDDDVSLMVVWMSCRLPYQFAETEQQSE